MLVMKCVMWQEEGKEKGGMLNVKGGEGIRGRGKERKEMLKRRGRWRKIEEKRGGIGCEGWRRNTRNGGGEKERKEMLNRRGRWRRIEKRGEIGCEGWRRKKGRSGGEKPRKRRCWM